MIIVKRENNGVSISMSGSFGDQLFECGALLNTLHEGIEKAVETELPEDLFLDIIKAEMVKARGHEAATRIVKAALEAIENGADRQKTFAGVLGQLKAVAADGLPGLIATVEVDEDRLRKLFGLDEEEKEG